MSRYVPKPDLEGINAPEKPSWFKDALILVGGFLGIVAVFYFVFASAADWIVARISPETEMRYLSKLVSKSPLSGRIVKESEVHPEFSRLTKTFINQTQLPLKVFIVCEEAPNAFALPGGVIYLTSGLFAKVHSENGLAFVLGHEIGHFMNRDHLRGLSREILFATGAALLGFAEVGGAHAFNQALSRQFSRAQELAADDYALNLMQKIYHHTFGAEEFLTEVGKGDSQFDQTLARFASTHPVTSERVERIKATQTNQTAEAKAVRSSIKEWRPKECK